MGEAQCQPEQREEAGHHQARPPENPGLDEKTNVPCAPKKQRGINDCRDGDGRQPPTAGRFVGRQRQSRDERVTDRVANPKSSNNRARKDGETKKPRHEHIALDF